MSQKDVNIIEKNCSVRNKKMSAVQYSKLLNLFGALVVFSNIKAQAPTRAPESVRPGG